MESCEQKPRKPWPSFPLSPHRNGKWYIAISRSGKKRFYYFGTWADPMNALAEYHAVAAKIHAEAAPTPDPDLATVREVVDRFLVHQENRLAAGEIRVAHFDDQRTALRRFVAAVGRDRLVSSLTESDLSAYRAGMKGGATTRSRYIGWVRAMFAHSHPSLCPQPLHRSPSLRAVPKRVVRAERQEFQRQHGRPILRRKEIRKLIRHASPTLKAHILLAINGGMGAKDIADLHPSDVDLTTGRIDTLRGKTGVRRQVVLWPETIRAMKAIRPGRDRFFLSRDGNALVRYVPKLGDAGEILSVTRHDTIKSAFDRLLRKHGLKRKRLGFYCLRRAFRTVADACGDRNAVLRIMGHELPGVDPHYVLAMPWRRIEKITRRVRRWLRRTAKRTGNASADGTTATPSTQ